MSGANGEDDFVSLKVLFAISRFDAFGGSGGVEEGEGNGALELAVASDFAGNENGDLEGEDAGCVRLGGELVDVAAGWPKLKGELDAGAEGGTVLNIEPEDDMAGWVKIKGGFEVAGADGIEPNGELEGAVVAGAKSKGEVDAVADVCAGPRGVPDAPASAGGCSA